MERLGWLDYFANVPFIADWETLDDETRVELENRLKYSENKLEILLADWVDKNFNQEKRSRILDFLDSDTGRKFWDALDNAARISHGIIEDWFHRIDDESWEVLEHEFSKEERETILDFFDTEAGKEFLAMLRDSQDPDWSIFEDLGEWLSARHMERWKVLREEEGEAGSIRGYR